jgi:hypothetical protein
VERLADAAVQDMQARYDLALVVRALRQRESAAVVLVAG